jgi:hypothetical protein
MTTLRVGERTGWLLHEFGLGLGVHRSPDGEVEFDFAAGLHLARGVWSLCFEGRVTNLVGEKAGALEVLAKAGNEPRVVESNSHLPQVFNLPFGADRAQLYR